MPPPSDLLLLAVSGRRLSSLFTAGGIVAEIPALAAPFLRFKLDGVASSFVDGALRHTVGFKRNCPSFRFADYKNLYVSSLAL